MADEDTPLTFKVKAGASATHTITMPQSATVAELKAHLAELESIASDRQRLIYSGRVLKNDDTLASYSIKEGNTVHLVKSAASNMQNQARPAQPEGGGSTAPRPPAGVPTNMAAGTHGDPLAGLSTARYAGMGLNLPSREMFGPDGGLGPLPSGEDLARMMRQPEYRAAMEQLLDNPQFLDQMLASNPMMRDMPNAREMMRSPLMRSLLLNPDMLSMMGGLGQGLGASEPFPAPGRTDSTPEGAPATDDANTTSTGAAGARQNAADPFGLFGADPNALNGLLAAMAGRGAGADTGTAAPSNPDSTTTRPPNPFTGLFGMPGANLDAAAMEQMARMFGGAGGATPGLGSMFGGEPEPASTEPPEVRYEVQLRQLNEMGFHDFDRNVRALRMSGGNVQAAIEILFSDS